MGARTAASAKLAAGSCWRDAASALARLASRLTGRPRKLEPEIVERSETTVVSLALRRTGCALPASQGRQCPARARSTVRGLLPASDDGIARGRGSSGASGSAQPVARS
ncbi:MAG: hypothetical protein OXJ64_06830 [Boseongicola sp.]|nr:hypothetical protein [Boseongicola sp.]